MDWFNSSYSNDDLAEILSDYSKSVHGFRTRMRGAGRCTLAHELEMLDATVASLRSSSHQSEAIIAAEMPCASDWLFDQ